MGARAGASAHQNIDAEILQRGVEHLFHVGEEAVNLVDEKHLASADIAENAGKVELLLEHRTGGGGELHFELFTDDGGKGGLAEPGRPVEEHVVHGFATQARGLNGDAEVLLELGLAGKVGQAARAEARFKLQIFGLACAGNQLPVGHVLPA